MWVIESDGDTFNGMYSIWKTNPMLAGCMLIWHRQATLASSGEEIYFGTNISRL